MKRFAENAYKNTPKGTPFYLLGIAAFQSHDFQTATFLFDAAVSEDLQHHPDPGNAPALLTMQLDEKNPNQRALPIVQAVVSKIETTIARYNGRTGSRSLTTGEVRKYFLTYLLSASKPAHLRSLTTTFVSFFFEWDYRTKLIQLSESGSREPFFTHLFRGCLLFESLLKENKKKSPSKQTLQPILKELAADLGIPVPFNITATSFETIVRSLAPTQPIEDAIRSTVRTRNTLGHNLAWTATSLDATRYDLLAENIAVSCLHAISCLYR